MNYSEKEIAILLNNVSILRRTNNLSQKEMAKKLNIGVHTLNKIENGELPKRLGVKTLFLIEKHFNIPASMLFEEIKQ